MGFLSKIKELFSSEKYNEEDLEEMHKDSIDFLEDELNFEDKSAGIYRVKLKDTERLKDKLDEYDFEIKGTDEDGAVIIYDGGIWLKIKEENDELAIYEIE